MPWETNRTARLVRLGVRGQMEVAGGIWGYLRVSGGVRGYLGVSEGIKGYLGVSGITIINFMHLLGLFENLLQRTRTAAAFSMQTRCRSTGLVIKSIVIII